MDCGSELPDQRLVKDKDSSSGVDARVAPGARTGKRVGSYDGNE